MSDSDRAIADRAILDRAIPDRAIPDVHKELAIECMEALKQHYFPHQTCLTPHFITRGLNLKVIFPLMADILMLMADILMLITLASLTFCFVKCECQSWSQRVHNTNKIWSEILCNACKTEDM